MGMSASQARLLSITGRLTNNEFRAQILTNAKMRLSTQTAQATKAYNEALDSELLMFMNYDDDGEAAKVPLTHTLLSEYAPLKNQYILRNPGNKVLTTNIDAKNFVETDNLLDFLKRYDLVEGVEYSSKRIYEINPEWEDWKKDYEVWLSEKPNKDDYREVTPGETVFVDNEVYNASRLIECFNYSLNYNYRCYMHVLVALIGYGEHTTSDGITYKTGQCNFTDPDWNPYGVKWNWNTCSTDEELIMRSTRESLKTDPVSTEVVDGTTVTRKEGRTVPCRGDGSDAAQYNHPLVINDDGTRSGGYCYQKAVDLLWKYHENYQGWNTSNPSSVGGTASTEELEENWYFFEYDLGEFSTTEEIVSYPGYDEDYEDWKKREPKEPEKNKMHTEEYLSDIIVNDQDKAQWYTNLWHLLNDSDTANKVEWKHLKTSWGELTPEYGYKVSYKEKTVKQDMFEVLDSNLSDNAEWLQFALEHGIVSMERATFKNPSEDGQKVMEETSIGHAWKSIIYTEATDIVAVPDEEAVTKAEVEYKKQLKKIKAEDKKYDTDLKKLDTEHNALQTEYNAIKETIDKNVQRSFKMFS